jgi:hypothetical protein
VGCYLKGSDVAMNRMSEKDSFASKSPEGS